MYLIYCYLLHNGVFAFYMPLQPRTDECTAAVEDSMDADETTGATTDGTAGIGAEF